MSERDFDTAYRQMAADEEREREALEWAESTVEDVALAIDQDVLVDRGTNANGTHGDEPNELII